MSSGLISGRFGTYPNCGSPSNALFFNDVGKMYFFQPRKLGRGDPAGSVRLAFSSFEVFGGRMRPSPSNVLRGGVSDASIVHLPRNVGALAFSFLMVGCGRGYRSRLSYRCCLRNVRAR